MNRDYQREKQILRLKDYHNIFYYCRSINTPRPIIPVRWKEGENFLLTATFYIYCYIYQYARDILQCNRWLEGEPVLLKYGSMSEKSSYNQVIIKGRWKEWEEQTRNEPNINVKREMLCFYESNLNYINPSLWLEYQLEESIIKGDYNNKILEDML